MHWEKHCHDTCCWDAKNKICGAYFTYWCTFNWALQPELHHVPTFWFAVPKNHIYYCCPIQYRHSTLSGISLKIISTKHDYYVSCVVVPGPYLEAIKLDDKREELVPIQTLVYVLQAGLYTKHVRLKTLLADGSWPSFGGWQFAPRSSILFDIITTDRKVSF